jgi:hypothetical protein
MSAERRELTEAEKAQLRGQFSDCYLCETTLAGYGPGEIQYDHIYAYADGYSQDLANFAPVHASKEPGKRNCHKEKGRKSPYQYKEELRIRKDMANVTGLRDICKVAEPLDVALDITNRTIRLNGRSVPLYSQRFNNEDHFYFFDEIETRNIENDDKIQLRPLEDKIVAMIFHLRRHVQLLPSLGRLDLKEKKVKVFDGQHKAVAQIVGNRRDRVPCIVFVNPDVEQLRITVFAAHTDFLQQRYKKSHIDDKLADIYADRIRTFRETVGNPQAPYTEKDILRHDSAANRRKFLLSAIIDGLKACGEFIDAYVAQDKKGQKQKPMIWESLELFVKTVCNLEPVEAQSDSPQNFRGEEVENVRFLLECLEKHAIAGKWNPALPASEEHKLSRKYFYDKALTKWLPQLHKALTHAFDQMMGRASVGALCYREKFAPAVRQRFDRIFEKLVTHSVWMNPANDLTISGNSERQIEELFAAQGLDWVYLTKLA